MNSIRDYVRECLRGFTALRDALRDQPALTGVANPPNLTAVALAPSQVQSEEERFKVWCGNIGAHQTGTRSSLEYRLRDASHIRQQVVKVLASLSRYLVDARSLVIGETTPLEDEIPDSQDDGDDLLGLEDLGYEYELVQIFASVVDSTTRLMRLSITIRNPAPHDRFLRAKATSTKHNEPWDVQHARDKFPKADPELAERLGKALSQRRQYFKYRESHHDRLAHGIGQIGQDEAPGEVADDDDAETRTVFSTVASSLPLNLRIPAGERLERDSEPAVLDEDETSETGVSQTSFATSTSMPDKLRIPKLPEKALDGPFECRFCYMIISAPNSRAWKRHVHADLQPYICLWKDCSTPNRQFQRRSHWLSHILQYHWRSWYCSLGCSHEFSSRESIRSHIVDAHPEAASSTILNTLSSLGEKPRPFNQEVMCQICHVELRSITEYAKHAGRHLVDLALFALPSGNVDDEETNDEEMPVSNSSSDSEHESLDHIQQDRNIDEELPGGMHRSERGNTVEDPVIPSHTALGNEHPSDARRSSPVLANAAGFVESPVASPPGPEALHALPTSSPSLRDPETLPQNNPASDIDKPQQEVVQESNSVLVEGQFMSNAADHGKGLAPSEAVDLRNGPLASDDIPSRREDVYKTDMSRERRRISVHNEPENAHKNPSSGADLQQPKVKAHAGGDANIRTADIDDCSLPAFAYKLLKVAQGAGEEIIAQPHLCPKGNECGRFKSLTTMVGLINWGEDQNGMKLDVSEINERLALLYRSDTTSEGEIGFQMRPSRTRLDMSKSQRISLVSEAEGKAEYPHLLFRTIQRIWPPGSSPIPIGRYRENIQPSNDPLIQDPIGFKSKVVSRKHCEVLIQDGRWYIRDLGSSSGTFVNNVRLSEPTENSGLVALQSGDLVQLGINFRNFLEEPVFQCVRMRIYYETVEEGVATEYVSKSTSHVES